MYNYYSSSWFTIKVPQLYGVYTDTLQLVSYSPRWGCRYADQGDLQTTVTMGYTGIRGLEPPSFPSSIPISFLPPSSPPSPSFSLLLPSHLAISGEYYDCVIMVNSTTPLHVLHYSLTCLAELQCVLILRQRRKLLQGGHLLE